MNIGRDPYMGIDLTGEQIFRCVNEGALMADSGLSLFRCPGNSESAMPPKADLALILVKQSANDCDLNRSMQHIEQIAQLVFDIVASF